MLLNNFFKNAPEIEIDQLSSDSRLPMKDAIFFCTRGIRYNGHNYVKEAIQNGAKVVVYDEDIATSYPAVFIRVPDATDALARVANIYNGNPSQDMETVFVAGNRARSIMAYATKEIIDCFRLCGYIGRYGIRYGETNLLSLVPTLTILNNQRTLRSMKNADVLSCVFELSYAAITYKKLSGIHSDAFVYVGTAVDEREYADDESGYITAYRSFLSSLENVDVLLNSDDANFERLASAVKGKFVSFGCGDGADYQAVDIEVLENKTRFTLVCRQDSYLVETPMLGRSGVLPSLACIALLAERGYPLDRVIYHLGNIQLPDGFEEKIDLGQDFRVLVDKSSTLSELEDILRYAKEITDTHHKIVVIEGVGAQTERRFRDGLAGLLDKYADHVVITENDTHDQNPLELGTAFSKEIRKAKNVVIEDREDAIRAALDLMNEGDTLLILGKGNEKTLLRPLGKDFYKGDSECAKEYIRKNKEEMNEFSKVY